MGIFSSLFSAKSKKDEGVDNYPSWAVNPDQIKKFVELLVAMAKKKNIPERFVQGLIANDYGADALMITAGVWEQKGASFTDQARAVMDRIERYWSNSDVSTKKLFSK